MTPAANIFRRVVIAHVVALAATHPRMASAQPQVNQHAANVQAFQERVSEYVELHKRVAGGLPEIRATANPDDLSRRERALGDALAKARKGARLGELFGEALRPYLIRSVRDDWAARSASDRQGLLGEMPRQVKVQVNMRYPVTLPLLTVPSRLLARLPALPEQLEYRIFGRHLIIRDTGGNIVVDAVLNALPPMS